MVAKFETAFASTPAARLVVHEGATHGFTHRSAPVYDAAAEQASVRSVIELVSLQSAAH